MTPEVNDIMARLHQEMDGALKHLEEELIKIRAGKASPAMVAGVMVPYYGTPTPLNQVANVSAQDARTLSIKPWEKSMLQEIEKAIFGANLGFTPQGDGEQIRINIPPLTEERRKELAKQIRAEGENCKVSLRNDRKHAMDAIKALNKSGLSDDLAHDAEALVQKKTNSYGDKVNALVAAKEKEVMSM